MWTRLETQYLQRAADNKHLLHRDFLNLRPTAGDDIMVHITALESMATELNDLGVNISEHDLITTIMCTLPARFGFLASSWDNVPDNERSMDALRARIVSEQRRIELRHIEEQASLPPTTERDDSALQATGFQRTPLMRNIRGGRGRGRSNGRHEVIDRDSAKCTYCGKSRHYEFECRLRITHQGENQLPPPKRQNNDDNGGSRVNFSLISVCCLTDGDLNGFVLDSGATRHMCGELSYFSDLCDIPPNSWPINGIGGKILHAIGVGTIKITSFVNGISVEGELKNVLYVPDLGVTLISIGSLSINGYSVSFCNENASIQRGNTTVMTASRSGDGLYKVKAIVSQYATLDLSVDTSSQVTLHGCDKHFGHVDQQTIRRRANNLGIVGMAFTPGCSLYYCCLRIIIAVSTARFLARIQLDFTTVFLNRPFAVTAVPAGQFVDAHHLSLPIFKGSPWLSSCSTTPTVVSTMTTIHFREVEGCFMYAAVTVRIDITCIANQLGLHCQNPGLDHWKAAQRVLKHLATPRKHGLHFGGNDINNNILTRYLDADCAGDPDTRRSTFGYVFILNRDAVTGSSHRQPIGDVLPKAADEEIFSSCLNVFGLEKVPDIIEWYPHLFE
jgi:hypothetical protein